MNVSLQLQERQDASQKNPREIYMTMGVTECN